MLKAVIFLIFFVWEFAIEYNCSQWFQKTFEVFLWHSKRANQMKFIFFAEESSVARSFEQPAETMQSIALGALNILEACRMVESPIKLYHAGSSECFGDTGGVAANERTPFHPRSPCRSKSLSILVCFPVA